MSERYSIYYVREIWLVMSERNRIAHIMSERYSIYYAREVWLSTVREIYHILCQRGIAYIMFERYTMYYVREVQHIYARED